MPSPHETPAVRRAADRIKQAAQAIRFLTQRYRDARALFCDDKGDLRPEARRFLARLERRARSRGSLFHANPQEQARIIGRIEIVEDIADMLNYPSNKIAHLMTQHQEDIDHD